MGGCLPKLWQVWLSLGSNPRVVSILKEGYSLPFKVRPPLSRSPVIISQYADPVKNKHLKESLQALIQKTGGRKGVGPFISGFLQLVISGTKAQQQVEANPRPQSAEPIPGISLLQDGNPGDHQTLPSTRGVGHLAGLQRCLLSYSNMSKIVEVFEIPSQQSNLPIHRPTFRPFDGSVGVHKGRQGGQAYGTVSGYSNPPVPRRLVSESPLPGNVPTTYPEPFGPMSQSGLGSQHVKVGTGTLTGVQLCRLSFRPLSRPGQTHAGEVDNSVSENQISLGTRGLLGQAVHVPNWASDNHRKTSGIGTPSHAPYPVAFKEALACSRNSREDNSPTEVSPCSSEVVVGPRQRSERSTVTPITTRPPAVYRRLKRRLWHTLRRLHYKRPLVQVRRRLAHKFARTQGSPVGPKTV